MNRRSFMGSIFGVGAASFFGRVLPSLGATLATPISDYQRILALGWSYKGIVAESKHSESSERYFKFTKDADELHFDTRGELLPETFDYTESFWFITGTKSTEVSEVVRRRLKFTEPTSKDVMIELGNDTLEIGSDFKEFLNPNSREFTNPPTLTEFFSAESFESEEFLKEIAEAAEKKPIMPRHVDRFVGYGKSGSQDETFGKHFKISRHIIEDV